MQVRIIDTILFNIRAFGWRKGIHLPVYIFSKVKIYSIGTIEITCPLRRNLVSIGLNHKDTTAPYTIWNNTGTIRIGEKVYFHHGCIINNRGIILLEGHNVFSHDASLDISTTFSAGTHAVVGFFSEISDNDHHYCLDLPTHSVCSNAKPIQLGRYNWIGSHTYIKKGTITPDYTIVASPNTLLCKDYTDIAPYSVLGGAPAKVIKEGVRRIYNFRHEGEIRDFFAKHPNESYYSLPPTTDIDLYCQYE